MTNLQYYLMEDMQVTQIADTDGHTIGHIDNISEEFIPADNITLSILQMIEIALFMTHSKIIFI